MTLVALSPHDQARHYAAVRARLWPSRRQFIVVTKPRWTTPAITEVTTSPAQITDSWLVAGILEAVAREPRAAPRDVLRITAQAFGVPIDAVAGRSHRPLFSVPRQIAMAVAHQQMRGNLNGTYAAIGRAFGRDHTTVMHAVSKFGPLIEQAVNEAPPLQLKDS